VDIREDKATNLVTATFELPGMKKEDVQIDVHNDMLTVSGETRTANKREEDGFVLRERRYGKFSRSLSLPKGIQVSIVFMRESDMALTLVLKE